MDRLYLDNTFNNPRCKFPSRACCKKKIIEILGDHPEHEIVLAVYTLGKEDLLVDIALALQTRVVVGQSRMNMLQLLELRDVFTTNENEGRVRLVRRQAISRKNMTKWNAEAPTIAIIPSGLFSILDGKPYANQHDVFIVPYSDHSSYPELQEFVSRVCPRAIYPIVRDSNLMNSNCPVADMHNFGQFLDRSPIKQFDIPPTVQHYMSSDLSNPTSVVGFCKKFINLKRVKSSNPRCNHAKGVVFENNRDVDEETDGEPKEEATRSPSSPNKTQCQVEKQEQQVDENENHSILKMSSSKAFRTTESVSEQKDEGLKNSLEEERYTAVGIAGNYLLTNVRDDRLVESKTSKMLSQSSREPTTSLCPNLDKMKTNLSSGKKDLVNKKRKRTSMEEENSSRLGQDDVLIQTMSSKRSRTLPPSFVATPTTTIKQSSGVKLQPPKLSSSSVITEFFQRVNPQTQPTDKLDRVLVGSKQTSCNANVTSLLGEGKSRTMEQNLISTVRKPNHDSESTKMSFNKSKSSQNIMPISYKQHSGKPKLNPVSTLNDKEKALDRLTPSQQTKRNSERGTSPCHCSLKSHPSQAPFNHVVVIKRKHTKDISELQKRTKLTAALDKFISNHLGS